MTETVEFLEFSDAVKACENADMLWDITKSKLANFGVTSFLYGMSPSPTDVKQNGFVASTFKRHDYPQTYLDAIDLDSLLDVDYTVEVIQENRCCIWSDETDWNKNATREQLKLARLETELGMGVGISVPSTLFKEQGFSGFGLCAGELSADEFDHMWAHKQDEFMKVLSLFDLAMFGNHSTEIIGLSQREKDVLSFFAVGFRLNDIADLLNISSKTLEKYVASAKTKLKAKTRDHAVAKALHFNLIQL